MNAIRKCLFGFVTDLVISFKNTQIDTQFGYPFEHPGFSNDPDYTSMMY